MKKLYTILAGCLLSCIAVAQPAGWSHVQTFTVQNNVASQVTNYQLQLNINTQVLIAANQMLANGNDLRFGDDCNGSVLYNYWIESGLNTANTIVWVKVDTLPASGTMTLFMFYGNAAAPAVSAIPGVFIGPHSSTDSTANTQLSGSADAQRGHRFAPTEDVLVTAFGKNEPSSNPRYITLFDFATQAIISQQQVAGPSSQWSYGNIASPIWLTQNTQYLLEIFFPAGDDAYYFGASPTMGQHMVYFDMRYCNGCTQNTFPTNVLGGMHYGYVDMWYWTKQNLAAAPTVGPSGPLTTNVTLASAICAGDSATGTITVTGGATPYSYEWSPAAGVANPFSASTLISPAASETYTVTVTDGCGGTYTSTVSITVNPLPNVTAGVSDDSVCIGSSFTPMAGGAATYAWTGGLSNNVAFTPAFTDTYTVTGTDGNGCSASASVTVEVLHVPAVVASVTSATVCAGDSVTFTGSGADTYAWDNGVTDNVPYTPASSAMYHVTGTDMYGCTNVDSVMVSVNALPAVALSGPAMVCDLDGAYTLAGTPAGGTYIGPGVTGNSFNPAAATAGTHTLVYSYTDSVGCTASDSISVVVDLCLSIVNGEASTLQVFPNPFGTQFTMNLAEAGHVRMFNSLGEVVLEQEMNAGRNDINAEEFARGVYTLEVTTANGTATVKVVKQ
jgi:hypothetical protein